MEKNDRLKDARIRAGFPSASEAARSLGVKVSAYVHHENGRRDFDDAAAEMYARRFKVPVEWLAFGKKTPETGIDRQLQELPEEQSRRLITEFNAMIRAAKVLGKTSG